jgi:hypothetical protein
MIKTHDGLASLIIQQKFSQQQIAGDDLGKEEA